MADVTWLTDLALFAAGEGDGGGLGPLATWLWPFLAIGLLFWLLGVPPPPQDPATGQGLHTALKNHDRVIAAGGIYGVVAEVDHEANRVTVKVDEAANVRLRVTLSSVIPIPPDQPSDDKPSSK